MAYTIYTTYYIWYILYILHTIYTTYRYILLLSKKFMVQRGGTMGKVLAFHMADFIKSLAHMKSLNTIKSDLRGLNQE